MSTTALQAHNKPATGISNMVPANLDQAMRLAQMMSEGGLVPDHLRSSPANCLMVIEQSGRWGMSPFAVAQCTSVISGKLMFEGKLVAAAINSSGILSRRLNYKYEGEGKARTVTVSGQVKGENEVREVTVKLIEVATNNKVWEKQPDQQLSYAGARIWARRHAPEAMLGVYVPEEFHEGAPEEPEHSEPRDVTPPPEKPEYAQDAFDKNKGAWREMVIAGKKTPEDILATLESRFTLTSEQEATINGFGDEPEDAVEGEVLTKDDIVD